MISPNTNISKKKVFVAMSGGVDSSVVAGLMKEAGHEVVGVTMCFSISHPESKKPSCCGVDGIQDAQRAAQILGIPHYVLDFAKDINDHIIDNFTSEYLSGRTPNPCVQCNQHLKFGSLYHKVMTMGADALATGHYGKIYYNSSRNCFELKKAEDSRKDQSYFLYSIRRETLPKVLFPLGDMTKQEVRDHARRFGLTAVAEKTESQDICFVPDGGYQKFLENRLGKEIFAPGPYKNEQGEIIGTHKGIAYYTIGQRERLGIALGKPVYVYKIEKETNTVYVGPESMLYASGLLAGNFNPVSIEIPMEPMEVSVRIRYNAPEVKGTLSYVGDGRVRVDFSEPQKSVTPGQSVVFYDGDVVLAGATIDEPIALRTNVSN